MSVVYIKEQGAIVQKRSERILVSHGSKTLAELSMHNIESIALIGNIQITTQALFALMQNGIDINYFTFSGKYLGCTAAETSKNIFLRLAQYDIYQDMDKRLGIARNIVANKIKNQMNMVREHRWDAEDKLWKDEIKQMKILMEKVQYAENTNQLMGIEGKASNIYFKAFGRMFKCKFEFHGRNRRPPKDPINVIISLGYTFLTKEISSSLEAESFEMYLGFLHGIRYGRKSLPLDIVEEFRQPVVDRMAIKLFNKRIIQEFDFTFEDEKVILNEEGFRKFCKEFEYWMTDGDCSGRGQGFRACIRDQVRCLKNFVQKKGEYQPFCISMNKNT